MRLRAIRLTNVRRFVGETASIEGLGDGLSVICAPNESGKSTFFDALQAVFFVAHGSRAREVTGLQPHAGGRVEIAVDIDLPEGRFRVEKAYLSKAMARVSDRDSGRILAQDDAAEQWIGQVTGQALKGPAGLLWVRQGVTTLESATGTEKERLLAARRDLLSSVAGEIDLMTGGRRMDRVRDACLADLDRLATATGKPRRGGAWADVRDEIEALDTEIAGLAAQSRALASALDRRREIAERLAALDAPEKRAARAQAVMVAEAALQAAEAHAARREAAAQAAQVARLTADDAVRRQRALLDTLAPLPRLAAAVAQAERQAEDLGARLAEAREAEEATRVAHAAAALDLSAAREALAVARRAEAARAAAARRDALEVALRAAEAQEEALAGAVARLAGLKVTEAALASLERALDARARAEAAAVARGVTLRLSYDGTVRVMGAEGALSAGDTVVTARTDLVLPGIGRMVVEPGQAAADPAELVAAGAAVERALAACGVTTAEEARAALRQKAEAQAAHALATELLKAHAPEGIAALRAARAKAEAEAGAVSEAWGPDGDPEAALALAEAREAEARAALETARAVVAGLGEPLAQARAAVTVARERLAEAEAAAGDAATRDVRVAALGQAAAAAVGAAEAAEAARDAMDRGAPDLGTARAERATAEEAANLREEQARLAGVIQTQADLAVDERLAAAREARDVAIAREARLATEVAALQRLAAVLDETRLAAREAYFGPVQRELAPLLSLLAADSALTFDPDSLLPGTLARGGAEEPIGTLSGGTQEQIAILTRLAFARLFARAGTSVPVILDDALVHSDDARIVRMFTALHRVAADQQVIVFTCRTLAFEQLGGARPALTITPVR
jgi:hypothetical protein